MSESLIGRTLLSQFRVDANVASGGMGTVYRVWDLKRNTPLAMKVLHAELADDPAMFKRFQREARALERLAHPNIVPFYGLHRAEEFAFLLERFIDGPSLKDLLQQHRGEPLSFLEVLVFLKALCAGLGYAHAHGVVHCDVKPGNLMVDLGGNLYLTDFGIARHAESTTTTLAGAGTPAYMAPEQIRSEVVSPATDVYALGVVLFEMLTGQRPFRGTEAGAMRGGMTTNERIRYGHLHLAPPDPRTLNPAIPPALAQVLRSSLSKPPAARYHSMTALFAAACEAAGIQPDTVPERVPLPTSWGKPGAGPGSPEPGRPGFGEGVGEAGMPRWKWPVLGGRITTGLLGIAAVIVLILAFLLGRGGGSDGTARSTPAEAAQLIPTGEALSTPAGSTAGQAVSTAPLQDATLEPASLSPMPLTATQTVGRDPREGTPTGPAAINPSDGAEMVFVPAGEFLRGLSEDHIARIRSLCPDCDPYGWSDQVPQRRIYLDGFWIGRTEVTNAQFARFVANTGYMTIAEQKQASYVFSPSLDDFPYVEGADWRHPSGPGADIVGKEGVPVTQVSWDDAAAYCEWAGGRLPTEAEWEKAARGEDGRLFPWGDEPPDASRLNFNLYFDGPQQAGAYPQDASPYGALDMSGSLWEWVQDFYSESYYATAPDRNPAGPAQGEGHSLRGGSWGSQSQKFMHLVLTTSRLWNKPFIRSDVLGFRCAMDANAMQTPAETSAIQLTETAEVRNSSAQNVTAVLPGQSDILNTRSIWNLAPFKELSGSGVQEYEARVEPDEAWIWDFVWCATDRSGLKEILAPLSITFLIDGEPLPQHLIFEQEREALSLPDWQCHYWATKLQDWNRGSTVTLEIYYTLSTEIYDGQDHYPAGEYHHLLHIKAG
jgi:formylglycine-generating enzyme required for sulfatase activity